MSVPGSSERKYDASAAQFAQRICVVGIASSIGAPVRSNQSRACRCNGMKIATSWPSFASTFGNEPQTSPNPPVLAMGETSAVANRTFILHHREDGEDGDVFVLSVLSVVSYEIRIAAYPTTCE